MSSEPPPKRRKIGEDITVPVSVAPQPDESDISDDELREAIRLSLLESESDQDASIKSEQPTPEEPKKILSPLEEIRMIQQRRYQQSITTSGDKATPQPSLRDQQPKREPTEKAPNASNPPSGLNLSGKRVFLNKLSSKDPELAIDLEDIICKAQVQGGILGGVFDEALLELAYFFSENTPLVLCTKPTPGPQGLPMGLLSAPTSWTLAYSDALVHAKFMVLFYESYARIIIASGNFTKVEYKEIRQVIWYQDFPKATVQTTPKGSFEMNLRLFLQALSVPQSWISRLDSFDFSQATPTLILSVPQNTHTEPQSGLYHLFQATSKLMKPKGAPTLALLGASSKAAASRIVAQSNTVSLASDYWLKEFAGAVMGAKALPGPAAAVADSLQIVYPTDTVFRASGVQGDAFSVVLFKDQNPRHRFYTCRDISGGNVLLHSKVVYPESKSWYYIGSHNITKSAWGSSKSSPSNYELGIVFPAEGWEFQLPFQTPLVGYGETDKLGGVIRSWSPN